jgi:outer membrane receptor protein involved in Fe transport
MTLSTKWTRPFALLLGVLLLLGGNAFAQSSNGTITGTVTDKTGGAVANATVKIVSIDRGGETHNTTTDGVGTYRVSSLLPGRYKVTIEASGFAPTVVNDIDVRASLEVNASAVLEVTSTSATITVEASAGQELQTQSGELSGNISTAEVVNLPYFSGNPIELALTMPGVQDVANRDNFTNGVGFSVNGTRPRANNFLLDGQDNNDSNIAGQALQPVNHEAVGEVTILENSYSSEFGRGGGSVTNVVYKGGTNNWHGSGWDIITPSALSAIPAELGHNGTTKNPESITNTFGFSLGGPIKKDKLFFFATPQWNRFRANAGAQTLPILLPTAAGVAALKQIETNEGPNANIDYLLAAIGTLRGGPTSLTLEDAGLDASGNPRPAVEFGGFQRSDGSIVSNSIQWSFRTDYVISDHDQLTARYIRSTSTLTPDFFNNSQELPAFETEQGGTAYNFHASWVHTASARMVNELRFSYGNIQFQFAPTAATQASPLGTHFTVVLTDVANPGGGNLLYGLPGNEPTFRNHQTFQFQDGFSWSVGKHTLRFGGDIGLVFVSDGIPVDPRGTVAFAPGGKTAVAGTPGPCGLNKTCTSLANYIDNFIGTGGTVTKFFGNTTVNPFAPNYAPFFEDTWRVKQNFTLDLGLRYEYWGTPENVLQFPAVDSRFGSGLVGATFPSVFAAKQQADKNNFAPRIGFAYTPHFWNRILGGDKTVIRAGYGIFYDGIFTNILDNTAGGSPNGVSPRIVGSKNDNLGRGTADATGLLQSLQPVLSPFSAVTSISAHLLNPLTHQWNLDVQRSLPGGFNMTAAYVGTRGEHLFVNQELNPFGENPNFGSVTVRTNGGDSIYHSGQLLVERPFRHGLLLRGAYTYSKFIDDQSEVFVTSGGSSRSEDLRNQHLDRGPSAFDRRHRFTLAYLYELPYVHNRNNAAMMVLNAITSGWQSAGTITFSTGAPETVIDNFDVNGDGFNNDRPDLGNPKAPFNTVGIDGSQLGGPTGVFFPFDPCVFGTGGTCAPAPANTFHFLIPAGGNGNLGRNTFTSPGFQFWNLSAQKTVKLKERYNFIIRGEFYNAFNHPNLGIPNLAIFSNGFDNIGDTIHGGRTVVLWGKFSF